MSNRFLETLRTRGWAEVPFPVPKEELRRAADAFLDFCALPAEQKSALHRFLYPNDDIAQVGYFRRAQSSGQYDDKEVWNHHIRAGQILGSEPAWQNPKTVAFIRAADEILAVGLRVLTELFAFFEEEYSGLGERFLCGGQAPKIYLRFIKYIPKKPGEFLAKGHFDRGCLTLAVCESAPGLRLGKDAHSLQPLMHREHTSVFFPGVAFPECTDGTFSPMWHDVVQKSEDQYRPDCARWAIVLFADTHDMIPPTVAQARRLLV